MSNKSGTSSKVISLPMQGTGNFTVPIALPSGSSSFQPELNRVYITGNGNSPRWLGWSLSIPGVSRKTSKGITRYDDDRDIFILSRVEALVPVAEDCTETDTESRKSITYRPRTEGLFARIQHHRIVNLPDYPVQDYWEMRGKNGLVSYCGTPELQNDADETGVNGKDSDNFFAQYQITLI